MRKRRPRWRKRSACYYLNAMVEAFYPFVDNEGMMKRSSGGRAIAGDFEDGDYSEGGGEFWATLVVVVVLVAYGSRLSLECSSARKRRFLPCGGA